MGMKEDLFTPELSTSLSEIFYFHFFVSVLLSYGQTPADVLGTRGAHIDSSLILEFASGYFCASIIFLLPSSTSWT